MSQEEGLSTGCFDSDRGGLCGTDDPKVESAGGGVQTVSRGRPGWIYLRYSMNPLLTSQITVLGSGGGGTLGQSSSVRPGVPCERRLQGTWVFPHTRSPPYDDRDKTDAASPSRPSAEVDPPAIQSVQDPVLN